MEPTKVQKKIDTYSQSLPEREKKISRYKVEQDDAVFQANKIGVVIPIWIKDIDPATGANYPAICPVPFDCVLQKVSYWYDVAGPQRS